MEENKIQKWIENDARQLWEAIAEKEGLLGKHDYNCLTMYVNELKEVLDWCTTIREAERLKKMLKD